MPGRVEGRRKVWLLGVGGGLGLFAALVVLLVLAAYLAAARFGGGAVGLAQGSVPAAYEDLIAKWGNLCKALSPPVLAAQLYQESGWRQNAQSGAKAQGIAQFIPGTWATNGLDANGDGKRDVWDPRDAIPSAANYDCKLAKYVQDAPGDATNNMLAAYNAGAYAVIQHQGIPPYRETRNYVSTIRKMEQAFAGSRAGVDPSRQAAGAIYYAQERLGTPYLWGGTGSRAQGGRFDCSGLTRAAFRSVGIQLPRVANDQYNTGPHPRRDELLPGDMVFFATDKSDSRSIDHVGIYVGGGHMIDAPHTGARIRFDPIDTAKYFGATRPTASN